jgi:hypothetical protein
MRKNLEKVIVVGLIILAVVCAWAVLTANHLYVG